MGGRKKNTKGKKQKPRDDHAGASTTPETKKVSLSSARRNWSPECLKIGAALGDSASTTDFPRVRRSVKLTAFQRRKMKVEVHKSIAKFRALERKAGGQRESVDPLTSDDEESAKEASRYRRPTFFPRLRPLLKITATRRPAAERSTADPVREETQSPMKNINKME